jgi:hypothetical protein
MMTMADTGSNRRIHLLFHSLGLSCVGGALFLEALVFTDIFQHGYFMAVEGNQAILTLEMALTAFSLVYFAYLYLRFIRSAR